MYFRVVLNFDGSRVLNQLIELINRLQMQSRIIYTKWRPQEVGAVEGAVRGNLPSFWKCDYNIFCHHPHRHLNISTENSII